MPIVSKEQLFHYIVNLDWTGHFELPIEDVHWLADEVHQLLLGRKDRCEACGRSVELVVETALGTICEACLKLAVADAASARRKLEVS